MNSKIIAATAIIIGVIVLDLIDVQTLCGTSSCRDSVDALLLGWLILFSLGLFSGLVAKIFSATIFKLWWKFARIAIPTIFVLSTIINMGFHHTVGGFMNMSDVLDIPAHIFLYSVFVTGSFVQIYRGHRRGVSEG